MSELIRNRVVMTPLAMPTARPTRTPAAMAKGADPPCAATVRGGHARQRVDGPHGEVDAAADEHEGAGRRDDDRGRLLVEDVQEVRQSQEARADDREQDEERSANGMTIPPRRTRLEVRATADPEVARPVCRGAHDATRVGRERGLEERAPRSSRAPSRTAAIRPPRMTSTRCARPSTSSTSLEMSRTPMPSAARLVEQLVERLLAPRRRCRASARPR